MFGRDFQASRSKVIDELRSFIDEHEEKLKNDRVFIRNLNFASIFYSFPLSVLFLLIVIATFVGLGNLFYPGTIPVISFILLMWILNNYVIRRVLFSHHWELLSRVSNNLADYEKMVKSISSSDNNSSEKMNSAIRGHPHVSIVSCWRNERWHRIPSLLLVDGDIIALMGGDITPGLVQELVPKFPLDLEKSDFKHDWDLGSLIQHGETIRLRNRQPHSSTRGSSRYNDSYSRYQSLPADSIELLTLSGNIRCFVMKETPIRRFCAKIFENDANLKIESNFLEEMKSIFFNKRHFARELGEKPEGDTFIRSLFLMVCRTGWTLILPSLFGLFVILAIIRLCVVPSSQKYWALSIGLPSFIIFFVFVPFCLPVFLLLIETMALADILANTETNLISISSTSQKKKDDFSKASSHSKYPEFPVSTSVRRASLGSVSTLQNERNEAPNDIEDGIHIDHDEFLDEDIDDRAEELADKVSYNVTWSLYSKYFWKIICERLSWHGFDSENNLIPIPFLRSRILEVLGAVTMVCFVDDDVICEDYSVTEEIFLLVSNENNMESTAAKGTILDLHANPQASGSRFEDPMWWKFLPSLKPIGLNAMLTYSSFVESTRRWPMGSKIEKAMSEKISRNNSPSLLSRSNIALKGKLKRNNTKRSPTMMEIELVKHIRRTIPLESLVELAEEIGFSSEDLELFSKCLELNVIAPRFGDEKILEDTHAWGQEETRRRGTLHAQIRSVIVRDSRGGLQMMSQGDPTLLMKYCREYWDGSSIAPLTLADRKETMKVYDRYKKEDFDVVAFAYSPIPVLIQELILSVVDKSSFPLSDIPMHPSLIDISESQEKSNGMGTLRRRENCLFFVDPTTSEQIQERVLVKSVGNDVHHEGQIPLSQNIEAPSGEIEQDIDVDVDVDGDGDGDIYVDGDAEMDPDIDVEPDNEVDVDDIAVNKTESSDDLGNANTSYRIEITEEGVIESLNTQSNSQCMSDSRIHTDFSGSSNKNGERIISFDPFLRRRSISDPNIHHLLNDLTSDIEFDSILDESPVRLTTSTSMKSTTLLVEMDQIDDSISNFGTVVDSERMSEKDALTCSGESTVSDDFVVGDDVRQRRVLSTPVLTHSLSFSGISSCSAGQIDSTSSEFNSNIDVRMHHSYSEAPALSTTLYSNQSELEGLISSSIDIENDPEYIEESQRLAKADAMKSSPFSKSQSLSSHLEKLIFSDNTNTGLGSTTLNSMKEKKRESKKSRTRIGHTLRNLESTNLSDLNNRESSELSINMGIKKPKSRADQNPAYGRHRSLGSQIWPLMRQQVFLGLAASSVPVKPEAPNLMENLSSAGVRFVYFSPRNMRRSKPVAEKIGIQFDWNCAISLRKLDSHLEHDPHRYISTYADWDVHAKMPHGVDAIRHHLQEVDNVPLLVNLYTDSTPSTTREMIQIFKSYGEVVLSIGSSYRVDNQPIFQSSDVGLAVDFNPGSNSSIPCSVDDALEHLPLCNNQFLSKVDMLLTFQLVGLGSIPLLQTPSRLFSTGFNYLDKSSCNSKSDDCKIDVAASKLASLFMSQQMQNSMKLHSILDGIRIGRVFLLNALQALAFLSVSIVAMALWPLVSLAIPVNIPPSFPPSLLMIFIVVYIPILIASMLNNENHDNILKNTPRKSFFVMKRGDWDRFLEFLVVRSGSVALAVFIQGWIAYGAIFARSNQSWTKRMVEFAVIDFPMSVAHPNQELIKFWLLQDVMSCQFLLQILFQCSTLLERGQSITSFPTPWTHGYFYLAVTFIVLLHIIVMVIRDYDRSYQVDGVSYSSLNWISWTFLALGPMITMVLGYYYNQIDLKAYKRYLLFLRLEFDTKLGMHSPR